jgi:UDP-glucose 4-epimerase
LTSHKILVTGGAGFIGSHLVDELVSRGFGITILDNLSTGTLVNIEPHLAKGDIRLMQGDVRNTQEVRSALRDIDAVFHLAAITSVPYSIKEPVVTNDVNVTGTRNLLEASNSRDVKRFIFISTCAVYGDPQYLPVDEKHPLNPMSPYAASKLSGEEQCREFQEKQGLGTTVMRLFNVYGPRQGDNEYSGVIAKFIDNIRRGRQPVIYGDGEQTRDFVYVGDVVQALASSISQKNAIGQIFNIGLGRSVTINRLCELVLRKLKSHLRPVYEQPRAGEIRHSRAGIDKARRILGYNPRVPLEKGLDSLITSGTT